MLRYLKIVETLLIQNERFESEKRKGIEVEFSRFESQSLEQNMFYSSKSTIGIFVIFW